MTINNNCVSQYREIYLLSAQKARKAIEIEVSKFLYLIRAECAKSTIRDLTRSVSVTSNNPFSHYPQPSPTQPIQSSKSSKKRKDVDHEGDPCAKRIKIEETSAQVNIKKEESCLVPEIPQEQINYQKSFDELCDEFSRSVFLVPQRNLFDWFENLNQLRLQQDNTNSAIQIKWEEVKDQFIQSFWRSIASIDFNVDDYLSRLNPKLTRLVNLNWDPKLFNVISNRILNHYGDHLGSASPRYLGGFLTQIMLGAKDQLQNISDVKEIIFNFRGKFTSKTLILLLAASVKFFPDREFIERFKDEFYLRALTSQQRIDLVNLSVENNVRDVKFLHHLVDLNSFDALCDQFIENTLRTQRELFDQFESLNRLRLQLENINEVNQIKWKRVENFFIQTFQGSTLGMDAHANDYLSHVSPRLQRLLNLNWDPSIFNEIFKRFIDYYGDQFHNESLRFLGRFLNLIMLGAKNQLQEISKIKQMIFNHRDKIPTPRLIESLGIIMKFFPDREFVEKFKAEFDKRPLYEEQIHALIQLGVYNFTQEIA